MSYTAELKEHLRIVAFDPGTSTLGISVLDADIENKRIYLLHATTINAARYLRPSYESELFGNRQTRITHLQEFIARVFEVYRPDLVVSEDTYMGRFADAFESLTELLSAIRTTLYAYNSHTRLIMIETSVAKSTVGAPTSKKAVKVGTLKEAVQHAVFRLDDLLWTIDKHTLDEHAVDAVAVGYTLAKRILKEKGFI